MIDFDGEVRFRNFDFTDHDRAIGFFLREIAQYRMMLNGELNAPYREYINDKIKYYELALVALLKEQFPKRNLYEE